MSGKSPVSTKKFETEQQDSMRIGIKMQCVDIATGLSQNFLLYFCSHFLYRNKRISLLSNFGVNSRFFNGSEFTSTNWQVLHSDFFYLETELYRINCVNKTEQIFTWTKFYSFPSTFEFLLSRARKVRLLCRQDCDSICAAEMASVQWCCVVFLAKI